MSLKQRFGFEISYQLLLCLSLLRSKYFITLRADEDVLPRELSTKVIIEMTISCTP